MQAAAKAIQNYNHELWLKKMHNLPSCAARQRQMNVACSWITNYTSSVARQPLWRMIMACDHNNTTQASYGTRTYDERNRADLIFILRIQNTCTMSCSSFDKW